MKACPNCHTVHDQVKAGRNQSGSQRFLCNQCNRTYTPIPKTIGYPNKTRLHAIDMHKKGHSFRAVARQMGVGTQSVINWVRADNPSNHTIKTQTNPSGSVTINEFKGD